MELSEQLPLVAAMRRFSYPPTGAQQAPQHGPTLIATGLAILIVVAWWPAAPATTAMALVALGATHATLVRFPGFPSIVVVHAIVYAMLYALFFGAACHAMATRAGADAWRVIDLAVSVWPMALALRLSLAATSGGRPSTGRSSTGR